MISKDRELVYKMHHLSAGSRRGFRKITPEKNMNIRHKTPQKIHETSFEMTAAKGAVFSTEDCVLNIFQPQQWKAEM